MDDDLESDEPFSRDLINTKWPFEFTEIPYVEVLKPSAVILPFKRDKE